MTNLNPGCIIEYDENYKFLITDVIGDKVYYYSFQKEYVIVSTILCEVE